MNKKVNKNTQNKIRIFIYIVAVITFVMVVVYYFYNVLELIKNPTEVYMISNGSISVEEAVTGIVIREEYILEGENHKNGLEQIKAEGERVAKGEPVFSYHNKNEDALRKKIDELDAKINETMEAEQNNIFSSDIKLIDKQIETKLDNVYELNEIQKLNEYKKDINSSINKKAKIAGELSPAGSTLKKLIEERTEYANELNSGLEMINATQSGIVSYRVDDLEVILKPDDFSYLTIDMLEKLDIKTGQIVATSNEKGKIINNFTAYIAVIMDSKMSGEISVGKKMLIRLSTADEISAKVSYISEQSNGKRIIVFQMNDYVEKLINYRKISLDVIWSKKTGLKVPNAAIRYDGELTYVKKNRGGYTDEILVKIEEKNDTYSIISNYTKEELKELGFSTEMIKDRRTISLYDEILINNTR